MQQPSSGQGATKPLSAYARLWGLVGVSSLLFPIVACGGVAERATDGPLATTGGSAGASGAAGAGAGADSSGGATNLSVDLPAETGGRPPGAGATELACAPSAAVAPGCGLQRSSVVILDGDMQQLGYPSDSSCGTCRALCEACTDLKCELLASGRSNCNSFTLRLSACATPDGDPPCLNTAALAPYYLDASGKRWSVVQFAGEGPQPAYQAELDADVTLIIRDEVSERTLSGHVQVCAALGASLVVCK